VANYYGGSGNDLVLHWAGTLVMTWGYNGYGQLGNDSTRNSIEPIPALSSGVLAGKTVIAVSAGDYHSLALCSDGTLAAWGDNYWGQLGNNRTDISRVPVAVNTAGTVLAGKTVIAVSAGASHSLALCSDGTLAAWGYNNFGQLGNSSKVNSRVPVGVNTAGTVLAGKTVIAVSAGAIHSLALCSDGTLAAWGDNYAGQLGNDSTVNSLVPVSVTTADTVLAGKTVIAVSAGFVHNLALCSDGTLAAWGANFWGQLGNNRTDISRVPVAVNTPGTVLAGKTVIAVSAGRNHNLALCSDGTLAAWGYNNFGQLGNSIPNYSLVPVAVTTASLAPGERFVAIAQGHSADHRLGLVARRPPAPTLAALPATSIGGTSATLNGTVNANSGSATVSFEYGPTTAYGFTVAATPSTVTGTTPTAVSATLTGLSPVSSYHYRIKVVTSGGTFTSEGSSFVTLRVPQTITFGSLSTKTYGDAPFAVSATASSGLTPSYTIVSGPATISGATMTITGAGTVVVRASQAGDGTYAAATPVDQSITVSQKELSVVANAQAQLAGAATPTLTATITGFVRADTALVVSGSPALSTTATVNSLPGAYPITISQGSLSAANYRFVFSNSTLTVNALTQAQWASQHFTPSQLATPAISNPTADPDGDGLPNQLEYALGGDPWVAQAGIQPVVAISEGALTLSYTRRKDVGDLTYTIEVSANLTTWSSGNTVTQELTVTPIDSFRERVVVADRTPLTAGGRRFMRLSVRQ
jgi:alpha-tubulin suppressor-like RCC1 family protein